MVTYDQFEHALAGLGRNENVVESYELPKEKFKRVVNTFGISL